MRLSHLFAAAICVFLASGCAQLQQMNMADTLTLTPASFNDLPGWQDDQQGRAALALQRSCARIVRKNPEANFGIGGFAGTVDAWQKICRGLSDAVPMTDIDARVFFESHFTPYTMSGKNGTQGLFTGYYEPTLHGSLRRHGRFQVPIYGRPDDLVTLELGDFNDEWKGKSLVGRVRKDMRVVPYYTRAEITDGALAKSRKEIIWVDNAVDAFFLHIQGSGRIEIKNGRKTSVIHVGYAAQNGHPYVAIGKALLARGALEKDNVSMQSIRAWLEAHPDEAADVMNLDASYIFFRKLKGMDGQLDGPVGAEGVPLTPRRSLAVDNKKIPYGLPVFLAADDPDGGSIERLMVAQDTGGAIVGAVRGDFFWGAGEEAAHKAGLMKSAGRAWVLLPKAEDAASEAPAPVETAGPAPDTEKSSAPQGDTPSFWTRVFDKVREGAGKIRDGAKNLSDKLPPVEALPASDRGTLNN